MTPVLAACYFRAKREPDGQYDRLARVLAYTASVHCPGWQVRIDRIAPELPAPCTGNPSHAWNTSKLDWWNDVVQVCPDGTPVVLMDADMAILRPLDPLWADPFDLAYTIRDARTSRLPLNGGLVAIRVSPATKAAIRQWQQVNLGMCREGTKHAEYHKRYAGMNQSSFGCLLEEGGLSGLNVRQLSCQEWNCCEWLGFDRAITRVVHVKSRLRRAVFGSAPATHPTQGSLGGIVDLWHALERDALAMEAKSA